MPELPEVETTVKGIKPWLENKIIKKIKIHNPSLRWKIPEHLPIRYENCTICSVHRRAKYILLHLDTGSTIILHLGMSGSLTIINKETPLAKHDHFEIIMHDGVHLRLNDPRRFGCVLDSENYNTHKLIKNLGPEPLDKNFSGKYLKTKSQNRTKAIKNFIMDGNIVVGVGNIYASEALFLAKIHPQIPAGKISLKRYERLVNSIQLVLSKAISAGGTTLKDFVNADGKPGYFTQQLNVYGRKGQECTSCKTLISHVIIGQRSTFYCKSCQK